MDLRVTTRDDFIILCDAMFHVVSSSSPPAGGGSTIMCTDWDGGGYGSYLSLAVIVYPRQKKPRGTKRFVFFLFRIHPAKTKMRGGPPGGPGGHHSPKT